MAANRGVDAVLHDEIEELRAAAFPEPGRVTLYRNYARGRHRDTMTKRGRKALRGLLGEWYCENVCKRLLAVLCDRMRVLGYSVADTSVDEFIRDVWVRLWLPALAAELVWTTWRDGNCGVVLGWKGRKKRPVITREKWWDGAQGIFFAYDDEGEVLWACKEWKGPKGLRRTVYLPGSINRYVRGKTGEWQWVPYEDAEGNTVRGPQFHTTTGDEGGDPLGVAAVHFARRVEPPDGQPEHRDNFRDSFYGVSVYEGGLLGLQNGVNDVHHNLAVAARYTAFQIITASGISMPIDPQTGQERPLEVEPGAGLHSRSEKARFGAIPAGSLSELLKQLGNLMRAMSQTACVPEHLIAGVWPSGAALLRAEMPLIDQARKGAAVLGPPFASLMHKCLVLSNTYGGTSYDLSAHIQTLFEDPERFDPLTLTEVAVARAEYVSLQEVWRLMGYDTAKRTQLKAELQEEAAFRPAAVPGAAPEDDEAAGVFGAAAGAAAGTSTGAPAPGTDATDPATGELNLQAGIAAEKTLNGAQITAALQVIERLSPGGEGVRIDPRVATELLTAVGLPRETSERMVANSEGA